MANTVTEVLPKLLAQGLLALRQQAIAPRLVNRGYDVLAGAQGSTITIPIPSAIVAQDVAPANTPPTTADIAPTSKTITLDQWKEAAFYMTDKDYLEVMRGTIPMQASEAIKAIVNVVDSAILAKYKEFYSFVGTPGTTPFATDLSEFLAARKVLNNNLAPMDDRHMLVNPDAEANALAREAFQNASWRGDTNGIIKGQIGEKLGAMWHMSQNVPTHTSTPLTAGAATVNGAHAAGVTSVSIAKATNASPLVAGDIITFAGSTQTYTVGAAVTLAVGNTAVAIQPPLVTALAGSEAVALKASHAVNLLFHRDAIAFASRPLEQADPENLGTFRSAVDPVSGLALRLEVTREHKRTRWSFDILYGIAVVRPGFGVRVAG